jgi:hypothetical protein
MRVRHASELIGSKREGRLVLLTPEEFARLKAAPEPHKLPAEEYTRMILAAKGGEITPGEADRRIRKYGGGLHILPMPKPPS